MSDNSANDLFAMAATAIESNKVCVALLETVKGTDDRIALTAATLFVGYLIAGYEILHKEEGLEKAIELIRANTPYQKQAIEKAMRANGYEI